MNGGIILIDLTIPYGPYDMVHIVPVSTFLWEGVAFCPRGLSELYQGVSLKLTLHTRGYS